MAPNPMQIVTGVVRLSYANLFQPRSSNDDEDPRYSAMLIIPKSDKKTIATIRKAIEAATEVGKTRTWGGRIPKNLSITLRDGDEEGDLDKNPELEGCMFMNVSSRRKPGLIGTDREPITDPDDLYSGCFVRVQLGAFPYDTKGNKGVSFGLNHVLKVRDGDRLDGGMKAEDAFEGYFEEDDEDEGLI